MRRTTLVFTLGCALLGATSLAAQGPGGPMGGPPPGGAMGGPLGNPAEFLLAHTGDLQLSDAQVTRLAAIARRSDARRQTMAASFDSARSHRRIVGGDSAVRAQLRAAEQRQIEPLLQRMRTEMRADLRDAISVLTPDQQAQAWEMVARPDPTVFRRASGEGFRRMMMPGFRDMNGRDGGGPPDGGRRRAPERDDQMRRPPAGNSGTTQRLPG